MGKLLGPDAETLLFAAARDDHVRTVIKPALEPGHMGAVRPLFGFDARLSGQCSGKVAPAVHQCAWSGSPIGDLKPDLTIILDVPVEVGMQRAATAPRRRRARPVRGGRRIKFHQELREAYRQIAAREPQRCVLIDATADTATVAANIWAALRDRLFASRYRATRSISA